MIEEEYGIMAEAFEMRLKTTSTVLLIIFTLCLFLAKGYNLYNSDNADIIPIYMHMADHGNYSGEFYMEEAEKSSSSRFFISEIVAALLRAGLSIEVIMLVFYTLTFILTAYGIWKLSVRFFEDYPVIFYTAAFSIYSLTDITFRLGQAGFKFNMPLPSTFAAGICIFAYGLYFERIKATKWTYKAIALLLCGLTALLQAFIGLYFGGILLLCLFYEFLFHKNNLYKPVIITILGCMLFVVPIAVVFIPGMTGAADPLTPAQIVEILAKFRQPHHNYPASWAWTAYLEFAIIFVATVWMLKESENNKGKLFLPLIYITGSTAFLSVFINFIATSVLPLPFFSKLQSGRAFAPFIFAVCIAWALKATELIKEKHYWEAFSIFGILIVPLGGVFLFPFMLLTSKRAPAFNKLHSAGLVLVNTVTVLMAIYEPTAQPLKTCLWILSVSMVFWVLNLLADSVKVGTIIGISTITLFLLLIAKGQVFIKPEKPYPEMNTLAEKFNAATDDKGIVLSDPWLNESLYFRFYSSTSTVVSFKCFPHADDGIREWYSRMEKVGGVNLGEGKTTGITLGKRTWNELMDMAQKYNVSYLLANKSWFPDSPIKPLVENGDWLIYRLN
jgi:hypothetical protein